MNLRHIVFSLFILLGILNVSSQENEVSENLEGKDFSKLKYAWTAQWITHPTESTLDFGSFYFRREFDLSKDYDKFIIHISADNKYWLYVNGNYVGTGPETGDIANYRYESRDIAEYLNIGRNVIAVEVINFGEYRKASQQTFQTAMICQFDNSLGLKELNTGMPGWKVIKNKSKGMTPFVSDSLNGYYAAGPGDVFYVSKYNPDWNKLGYDDSLWLKPKPATIEFAAGRGFLYGSIWFLVPRTLPYHTDEPEPFKAIYENGEKCKLSDRDDLMHIEPNQKRSFIFDNGVHTIGMPELSFSKGKGSKIKLIYSEALYDENGAKGYRNEVKGKKILGYYDIVYPDGRENMCYKPTAMRTYRFVQMDVVTADEPLVINGYIGKRTAYPFTIEGNFESSDEKLNKIYEASCRTVLNSAFEDFIDPYFEQLQYIGDTRIESLVALSMSSDLRLMRKAILTFNNSRIPEGLTQSRYPSYITQVIPPYSLIWILMLYDYLTYGGDKDIITEVEPGCNGVLEWFERHIDKTGLLYDLRWWNFTDWASSYPNGIPPGADNGHSATLTLQYVYALQKMAEVYDYAGDAAKSYELRKRAERSVDAVRRLCYNEEKGMVKEAVENNVYSQHTQVLAVLTGLVSDKEKSVLLTKAINDKSIIQATIYFKFYMFEAMKVAGVKDLYFNSLSNWCNMIDDGLTTFAETDVNPRSECHGWSASPAYHFKNIIAGIEPLGFGFKKIRINPCLGNITDLKVSMPHPSGVIKVEYHSGKKYLEAVIELPEGVDGNFVFADKEFSLSQGCNKFKIKK